ncbi:MAG: hypothetical protein IE916_07250 [Epsilonproteobacteria bacterium]|nr:hypothetical protein [Campylobacterota bacterium]
MYSKTPESIAYVVNISGKQRMLSQHIALDVHKIYQLRQERNKEHEEAIQNRLEALCDEMLEANRILSSGELSSTKKIALSDEIRELYFGSKRVAQRVEAYALSAKELGRIKEPKAARELLKMIAHESEPLLADLNTVVLQYQKEGEERLVEIQHLEGIILVMTLFALLLEVIFIFQPLVRHIVELSKDNALAE